MELRVRDHQNLNPVFSRNLSKGATTQSADVGVLGCLGCWVTVVHKDRDVWQLHSLLRVPVLVHDGVRPEPGVVACQSARVPSFLLLPEARHLPPYEQRRVLRRRLLRKLPAALVRLVPAAPPASGKWRGHRRRRGAPCFPTGLPIHSPEDLRDAASHATAPGFKSLEYVHVAHSRTVTYSRSLASRRTSCGTPA